MQKKGGRIKRTGYQNLNIECRNSLCFSLSFCDYLKFFIIFFLSLVKRYRVGGHELGSRVLGREYGISRNSNSRNSTTSSESSKQLGIKGKEHRRASQVTTLSAKLRSLGFTL